MLLLGVVKADQVDHQRLRHIWKSQSNIGQNMHRLDCDLHVHVVGVLIKFIQHVAQVVLVGQHPQNLDLDVLDVSWLVNFAVKILEIFLVLALAIHVLYHVLNVF